MEETYPNVMIINDTNESPEELIQDYLEMITHYKDDPNVIKVLLHSMFDDVAYLTTRQIIIDQTKASMESLRILDETEHAFDEDGE